MNSRNTPKTHLVPVIKGVSDPSKGLIFRTYHVRPEQLQASLKDATTQPDPIQIGSIKNYDKLSKSIHSNDITHLRSMFSEKSDIWDSIVKRDKTKDVSHNKGKQKLMQSVYAYFLSQDDMFASAIKTHANTAVTKKAKTVKHIEKTPSKKARVHEKGIYIPVVESTNYDFFEILTPVTLSAVKNPQSLASKVKNPQDIDNGKELIMQDEETEFDISSEIGVDLSSFINFINPSSNKIVNLHKVLSSKSDRDSSLSKNLILRPHVYLERKNYWSEILANNILENIKNTEKDMSEECQLYSALILKSIDKKRFDDICTYSSNILLNKIKYNNPEYILNDTTLSLKDKSYYILALNDGDTTKYKDTIFRLIKNTGTILDKLMLFASYSNHLPINVTYKLFNTIFPSFFVIDDLFERALNTESDHGISYTLLQLVFSKIGKYHYTPYNDTSLFKENPVISFLVVKLFSAFLKYHFDALKEKVNTIKNSASEEVKEVGYQRKERLISDSQIFIRALPLMVFENVLSDNTYLYKGTISTKYILYEKDEKLLIYDALTNLQL